MARPRSARAHQKVLDAALRLFASEGIDATSMDAIAAASGVSKATIYNHWRDKDALCVEVMACLHGLDEPPITKTGDHRRDIVSILAHRPAERESDLANRVMPHFAAYAARKPEFAKAWRARMLQPARIQILQLLKRSVAEGELPRGLNLEVSVALLMGPLMYRYVLTLMGGRLPSDLAERVVDAFWRAHAVETKRHPV
jgi:AcrR family transcriptional regulator